MNFDELIGQKKAITTLKQNISSGSISHGYVFSGVAGIGKKTLAAAFVAALFCEKPIDGIKPCGFCQACVLTEEDSNPDLILITNDENSIGVEEIREKLQTSVLIKPAYSKRKIYLIIDADKMTVQAQNCILKTLEEPPPYCTIILTVSNYDSLLETVRSRSVHIPLLPCSKEEIIKIICQMKNESGLENEVIAALSQGIPQKAIRIMESQSFTELREKTVGLTASIIRKKEKAAVEHFAFFNEYKEEYEDILEIMLGLFRDMLVLKTTNTENMLINADKKDIILSCAYRADINWLSANIDRIEEARRQLRHNVNYNLSIETMLLKLGEE